MHVNGQGGSGEKSECSAEGKREGAPGGMQKQSRKNKRLKTGKRKGEYIDDF